MAGVVSSKFWMKPESLREENIVYEVVESLIEKLLSGKSRLFVNGKCGERGHLEGA